MHSISGSRKGRKSQTVYYIDGIRVKEMTPASSFKEDLENESYDKIQENTFKSAFHNPLSTFSIDVDRASYANIRRMIMDGYSPKVDAVRIEEMINYFDYGYPNSQNEHPFSVNTEMHICPWNENNKLLHIGLKANEIEQAEMPPSNFVFLIDVSGSMSSRDKLPLVKKSLEMLVKKLGKYDQISIVVYAGAAGAVLEPTRGNKKERIINAIKNLDAGGSTAGAAGIELAYQLAENNFIDDGNNRVILATDGDFNVGMQSDADMERLIEEKRKSGIYLSCLGFGSGNYKDSKMETLANKGNGNYNYIDNLFEARKVLVSELGGTLITVAKDVKIQVEFNPSVVESYRLIGYENRLLEDEDFNDDTKDAGEIGAGHTVTALYELVMDEGSELNPDIEELRFQKEIDNVHPQELLVLKLRYKKPNEKESILLQEVVKNEDSKSKSDNFIWSSGVASFGMLLRHSEYANGISFTDVKKMAKKGRGDDEMGYRSEMIRLIDLATSIAGD